MRSNIIYDTAPTIETKDIKDLGFGTKYKGKHEVWTFRFSPERSGAYEEGGNIIGCLLNDLHEIPIIKKLSETINIEKAVFDVKDPAFKNTIIKALQGTI
jgi:hypothetical protein